MKPVVIVATLLALALLGVSGAQPLMSTCHGRRTRPTVAQRHQAARVPLRLLHRPHPALSRRSTWRSLNRVARPQIMRFRPSRLISRYYVNNLRAAIIWPTAENPSRRLCPCRNAHRMKS